MQLPECGDRRLLVVTESLGVGGTESHLLRTLPRLVAAGWSVATFCLTERGETRWHGHDVVWYGIDR